MEGENFPGIEVAGTVEVKHTIGRGDVSQGEFIVVDVEIGGTCSGGSRVRERVAQVCKRQGILRCIRLCDPIHKGDPTDRPGAACRKGNLFRDFQGSGADTKIAPEGDRPGEGGTGERAKNGRCCRDVLWAEMTKGETMGGAHK